MKRKIMEFINAGSIILITTSATYGIGKLFLTMW